MNDLATFQRALDDLDTGLDDAPDLARIRGAGRGRRRRRHVLQGLAAAAVVGVLGVTAVPSWRGAVPWSTSPRFAAGAGGPYVALGDPGWQVTDLSTSPGLVDLTYARRAEELEIAIYPASLYAGYYADRSELADRQSIQVLGQDATMWTYSAHDHTAIRTAQDGHFVEVRGTGMDVDAFRALLADLVQTDQAGLAGSMPGSVTTPGDRDRVGRRLLQGVDLPPGFTDANVTLTAFNDAYQTAAQVAGQVGCAWLDAFDSGSAADRQAAVAALDGSRRWPLLVDIADQGGYAQVFWGTADRLDALSRDPGASAAGLRQGIC